MEVPPRLAHGQHVTATTMQVLGQPLDLRRLAAALGAFEGDEQTHVSLWRMGEVVSPQRLFVINTHAACRLLAIRVAHQVRLANQFVLLPADESVLRRKID